MHDQIRPHTLQALRGTVIKAVKEAIEPIHGKWAQNKLVWRIDEVAHQIGLSQSTINNLLDEEGQWFDPEFPKPIRLGNGAGTRSAKGWRREDIVKWVNSRPKHDTSH